MPTYDYKCLKCRHAFEHSQRMSDKPLTRCPKCKGKVERLIGGGAGLIFKGSGFYITDYKKKSGTPPESKPASPAPKTETPKTESPKTESPKTVPKKNSE